MNNWIFKSVLVVALTQSAYADLHDPTRPAEYIENKSGPVDISKLELSLTLVSSDRNVVVINGIPLKVGDTISGQRVDMIELNSVRLTGSSGSITLFLLDKSVKQPAQ